jgi:broad specificity phosphatase PhoE
LSYITEPRQANVLTNISYHKSYSQEQAEALAKFLSSPSSYPYSTSKPSSYIEPATKGSRPSSDLPTPELVFSSPFYRCVQTAAPTARELGVEVRLEHGVQEW